MRKTKATFKVTGAHIDGKAAGTLVIEPPGPRGEILTTYRPKGGREYTLLLSEVCEMIAWRAVKKEGNK